MTQLTGTIAGLTRYPVKSMLGETLETCEATERGMTGDRTHALVDVETGKVASAKQPRLWRGLLQFQATHTGDGVRITAPDGKTISNTDADADAVLSDAIGRSVNLSSVREAGATIERSNPDMVLERGMNADVEGEPLELAQAAPHGGFFDFAPLHVITANSFRKIADTMPDGQIKLQRYRPNIFIDLPDAPAFIENEWREKTLVIGDDLRLQIVLPTPRCAIPMQAHGDLEACTDALSKVTQANRVELPEIAPGEFPCLGAFAVILSPGELRIGQKVTLEG